MSITNETDAAPAPARILRVGIVGTGEIAQVTHLPTLALLSHLFKVVALCDVSKDSLAHCATKFHINKTYTDFSDMAKDPEIDIVMILTADEYHAAYAVEAADNGKAVFIEKPMALTHADAQAIIDAETRNKVCIFVGFMRRYATAFTVAKELIQGLKKIDYVRVRDIIGFNQFFVDESGFFPEKFTDFPAEANADRVAKGNKMAQTAIGSLATSDPSKVMTYRFLAGLGSHDLSAMRELIGPPKSCFASSRAASGLFITALLEYEGFTATYETGIDGVAKFDAHIEVHGDGKRIKVTYDTPYVKGLPITVTVLEAGPDGFQERIIRPTYKDAYTLELEQLYRCVAEGAPCKTAPSDAAEDLKIFDMIMGALRS